MSLNIQIIIINNKIIRFEVMRNFHVNMLYWLMSEQYMGCGAILLQPNFLKNFHFSISCVDWHYPHRPGFSLFTARKSKEEDHFAAPKWHCMASMHSLWTVEPVVIFCVGLLKAEVYSCYPHPRNLLDLKQVTHTQRNSVHTLSHARGSRWELQNALKQCISNHGHHYSNIIFRTK